MDDQVSKVPVVVDLELRGLKRNGGCVRKLKTDYWPHLYFVAGKNWKLLLYLNLSSDGMRCLCHLCCLENILKRQSVKC